MLRIAAAIDLTTPGSTPDSLSAAATTDPSCDPGTTGTGSPTSSSGGTTNLSSTGLAVGGALVAIVAFLALGAAALLYRNRGLKR
ncbi:hypothetical protein GCM10009563_06480 [Subtercola frigoramans]